MSQKAQHSHRTAFTDWNHTRATLTWSATQTYKIIFQVYTEIEVTLVKLTSSTTKE